MLPPHRFLWQLVHTLRSLISQTRISQDSGPSVAIFLLFLIISQLEAEPVPSVLELRQAVHLRGVLWPVGGRLVFPVLGADLATTGHRALVRPDQNHSLIR